MSAGLLTLPEASRRVLAMGSRVKLDVRGHKLRRLLLGAERRAGRRLGVRLSGQRRTQWRVSEAILRRYLPELFAGARAELEEMGKLVRRHLRDVDRRSADVAREVVAAEMVSARGEWQAGDTTVMEAVVEVAEKVGSLARRVAVLEQGGG